MKNVRINNQHKVSYESKEGLVLHCKLRWMTMSVSEQMDQQLHSWRANAIIPMQMIRQPAMHTDDLTNLKTYAS
jgi:hypothetical protein